MPPIGAQPERPRDLEERDAIELLDTTATWNAAIEAAAKVVDREHEYASWNDQDEYWRGRTDGSSDTAETIRLLKRPRDAVSALDAAIAADPRYKPAVARTRRMIARMGYVSPAMWDQTVRELCEQFEREAATRAARRQTGS